MPSERKIIREGIADVTTLAVLGRHHTRHRQRTAGAGAQHDGCRQAPSIDRKAGGRQRSGDSIRRCRVDVEQSEHPDHCLGAHFDLLAP